MPYAEHIAGTLNIRPAQVAATIELFDAGNTIPFVARYRKERTGGLDEEQLREISSALETLRALDERREAILTAIEAQGRLTPELRSQLLAARTRTELEDLYQPYKPKRRTRASIARERGLEKLAELILPQPRTGQSRAQLGTPFVTPDVPTVEESFAGARDIVAEVVSDHPDIVRMTREKALQWGMLQAEKIEAAQDARGVD